MAPDNTVMIEGGRIIFRNFAGREGPYNRDGSKNFGVILPEDMAQVLTADGWNVKWLKPREVEGEGAEEGGETPTPWLPCEVRFSGPRPPKIVLITSHNRTILHDDTVETLDLVDIINADMILNPYPWAVNGKTGVKAYVQSLYVTIQEDALEEKYSRMLAQSDNMGPASNE